MNSKTDGRSRILDLLYHRTAICLAAALVTAIVAGVPLGMIIFPGRDLIVFGWSPKSGESVSSLRSLIFTLLIVGLSVLAYVFAQRVFDKYIQARTRNGATGAHNKAL